MLPKGSGEVPRGQPQQRLRDSTYNDLDCIAVLVGNGASGLKSGISPPTLTDPPASLCAAGPTSADDFYEACLCLLAGKAPRGV